METFEYYEKQGLVKKGTQNLERAKALIKDANERISDIKLLSIEKFPKLFFEHLYDALRDFCDAILIIDGYKSYSHEASISHLSKKGFGIDAISKLDNFRFKRNGSKYYGQKILISDAKEILDFYNLTKGKFNKIFEEII